MNIKLRITNLKCTEEDLVKHILTISNPDSTVIVNETKGKTEHTQSHYHLYLETSITIPTIRTRLVKDWNMVGRGNEHYSISDKHHDWDVYIGYLYKHSTDTDNPTRIVYEPDTYDRQHYISRYDNYTKVDTEKTAKAKNQNKDIIQYVDATTARTPREIAKAVCDYYLSKNMTFHKANIGAAVNMIWYKRGNETTFINQVLEVAGLEDETQDELTEIKRQNADLKRHLRNYLMNKGEWNDPE